MSDIPQHQPRENESQLAIRRDRRQQRKDADQKDPAFYAADDEDVLPGKGKVLDKQSFDYLWRSGVAGGLAGCAVSFLYPPSHPGLTPKLLS